MEDFKKLDGRPMLKKGRRTEKLDVRLTEEEYQLVVALEEEFGISKTELVRMRLLNNAGQAVVNSKALIRRLDEIGAEMGRVGNNINQLAKHANTMELKGMLSPSVTGNFNELLQSYIRVLCALETTFRKIIRSMGR